MLLPLEISFRGLEHSDAIERRVRAKAAELERFYDPISSCQVTVEAPHHHSHQGTIYVVTIDIRVPNGELVVNRARREHPAHEDVYVAIRDAFDAAYRQLADYARKQRGDVKRHEPKTPHATISRMFPSDGYGFVKLPDGTEVYFHENSVVGDFASLEIGDEVRIALAELEGEKGQHASSVTRLARGSVVGEDAGA